MPEQSTAIVVPAFLRDAARAHIGELQDAIAEGGPEPVDLERLARWARPVERPAVRPEYL